MNEVLLGPMGRRILQGYGWLLLVFVIAPAVILIPISFSGGSDFTFPPQALSLEWYDRLVDDPRWRDAALLSLKVAAFASVLAAVRGPRPPLPSAAWRRTTPAM